MDTLDSTRPAELFFPLSPTALSTSTGSNNLGAFDVTTGQGAYSYLKNTGTGEDFGLPSDAGIAMMTNGQPAFPIYNNNAQYTPAKCEVDSCNEHVGQGGGPPHFHGDPFGDEQSGHKCLYGPSNYTGGSATAHPPVIGFSYDGYLIYGRYLSDSAPGFNSPALDACGGHAHANAADVDEHGISLATYHYHAQIFDATVQAGEIATAGETYTATTPGPFQCWKADIAAATDGSSARLAASASAPAKNTMNYHCCGMTDYYLLTGNTFSNTNSIASTSSCSAPAAPDNGAYTGTACATAGATLYSGYTCSPTCNTGYTVSGTTRCVKGAITETATCVASSTTPTVVNCAYTWSAWGECSATTSTQTRTITITTAASGGGTACPTSPESQACTPGVVNCDYSWSAWGACSATTSTQSRTISVTTAASGGGTACPTSPETQACTPATTTTTTYCSSYTCSGTVVARANSQLIACAATGCDATTCCEESSTMSAGASVRPGVVGSLLMVLLIAASLFVAFPAQQ